MRMTQARKSLTDQIAIPDFVVVTAKRLDSDEVIESVTKVETPGSELEMRKQLADLVGSLYPSAEFRSFANHAATYLAPKLLVVAVYRLSGRRDDLAGEDDDAQQQQLFAA